MTRIKHHRSDQTKLSIIYAICSSTSELVAQPHRLAKCNRVRVITMSPARARAHVDKHQRMHLRGMFFYCHTARQPCVCVCALVCDDALEPLKLFILLLYEPLAVGARARACVSGCGCVDAVHMILMFPVADADGHTVYTQFVIYMAGWCSINVMARVFMCTASIIL